MNKENEDDILDKIELLAEENKELKEAVGDTLLELEEANNLVIDLKDDVDRESKLATSYQEERDEYKDILVEIQASVISVDLS